MQIADGLGYRFAAGATSFHRGDVEIRRVSKVDPESSDTLMLDLLL
jgi:hypothetical protein